MSKKAVGRCRICGRVEPLSREHVIPKSAGNAGPVSVRSLYSIANGWSRGELFQNGLTRSALCEPCNNICGRHFVRSFAHWTLQGALYHQRLKGAARVLLPFSLVPLAVAKQLAVMTLAMAHAESIDLPHFLDLRRFVLSPARHGSIGSFRFYTYFHFGAAVFDGAFYALDTAGGPCPMVHCHVGREPLGYFVTADDAASIRWAERLRLCDITAFSRRQQHVISIEHLWLPCLRG